MAEFIAGDIVAERSTDTVWKVIAYNEGQKVAFCELLAADECVIRAIRAAQLRLTSPEED